MFLANRFLLPFIARSLNPPTATGFKDSIRKKHHSMIVISALGRFFCRRLCLWINAKFLVQSYWSYRPAYTMWVGRRISYILNWGVLRSILMLQGWGLTVKSLIEDQLRGRNSCGKIFHLIPRKIFRSRAFADMNEDAAKWFGVLSWSYWGWLSIHGK